MEEILHQLIGSFSHYLQVLYIPGGAGFFPSTVGLSQCGIVHGHAHGGPFRFGHAHLRRGNGLNEKTHGADVKTRGSVELTLEPVVFVGFGAAILSKRSSFPINIRVTDR